MVLTVADDTGSAPGRGSRGDATRLALLIAAAEQFYVSGYHAGSVGEIAANAGVTKGAFYFHFRHKRELAEAVIAEMASIWAKVIGEITARGLDPLSTVLAIVDAVVVHLVSGPVVRGGTRLLHDPMLRSGGTVDLAADQYAFAEAAVTTQLAAAGAAGLLRPCLADPSQAPLGQLARSITATVIGHHLVCDLTGTESELWDRVTAMWQTLLPMIADERWLQGWDPHAWALRAQPEPTHRLPSQPDPVGR